MSTELILPPPELQALYPESDGEPMGDNTEQIFWIVFLLGNLEDLFADEHNVFVASNLLWYPIEGEPKIRAAPDVMIAFGRPAGERSSYLQWVEGGIAPQVVFEIQSPGNTAADMESTLAFYDEHQVEEYYVYDFRRGRLLGRRRVAGGALAPIPQMQGWVSPRLGVRFELFHGILRMYFPDGRPFVSRRQIVKERDEALVRLEQANSLIERLAEQLKRAGIAPHNEGLATDAPDPS